MNRTLLSAIALAVASLSTAAALAAGPQASSGPVTRDRVRAELAEAIRTGNMVGNSESGQKLNELFPDLYPQKAHAARATKGADAQAAAPALTRQQVRAELAEAIRTGNVVANSESGQKANELFPGLYPTHAARQGLTREQVRAELAEAIRTGNVVANSESGQKANELMPHLYPRQTALQTRTRAEVQAELSAGRQGSSRSGHALAPVDGKR